ncbi:MAG TPA: transcriptional repressor [Clostridiales bacterium]|nr:transcriptional repressor [Clostridiales bacterium]
MNDVELGEAVRRCGLKNTKGRSAILGILEKSERPVSAEQVFMAMRDGGISANLSTVYRTLEALADKGLARKLTIAGDSRNLYEFNRMEHRHYLVCLACNKIVAIDSCPLRDYEKRLSAETGYLITGHRLDVYGYCPECRISYPQCPAP